MRTLLLVATFSCSSLLPLPFLACKDGPPPAATGGTDSTAAASAAAYGSASATPPPGAPTVLALSDSGKPLTLAVGASLVVKLRATGGTGFTWDVTQGDPNILALSGPPTTETEGSQPGAAALQVFSFMGKTPGATHLELFFHRPWDHGPAAQTFSADVTVR